jgi:hypothetical protein
MRDATKQTFLPTRPSMGCNKWFLDTLAWPHWQRRVAIAPERTTHDICK